MVCLRPRSDIVESDSSESTRLLDRPQALQKFDSLVQDIFLAIDEHLKGATSLADLKFDRFDL